MALNKMQNFSFTHIDQPDRPQESASTRKQQWDSRGDELRAFINNLVDILNSQEGASNITATPISSLEGDNVQALIESLRNKLKGVAEGSSGADFIKSSGIEGLTGSTVQELLKALKTYADTMQPRDALQSKVNMEKGAIASISGVDNAKGDVQIKAGTGITVNPNPESKTITITATGEAVPGAHAAEHGMYGGDPITPALIGAAGASQLSNLAGVGRTTETVKKNAEDIASLQQEVIAHKADDVSQREVHGLRVNNEKLEYYTGTEWKIASGGIPVGNVSGLSVEEGNAEITLMWTDPEDRYLDDLKIAEWQGTKIIRKTGSYPVSDDDGVLVVDNKTRNQYSSNGYTDVGLTNDETYYYMAFPYTEDAITVDGANRVAGTPTDVDDPSGSPGSPNLISGTMEEGFFGEVPASELITGDALASECGISQGTSQYSTAGWLKFAYKGEILFVAKKPIRHSISWDAINTAKCVYGDSGDKTVTIDDKTYKVTLMRALEPSNDPKTVASGSSGAVNHHSEWNRLMCQIHEEAINGSWGYPDNIESDIGILEHSLGSGNQGMYSDADLIVVRGDGRLSWCQEMSTSTSDRLYRGFNGVSHSYYTTSSDANSFFGWRPVLRLES